MPSGTFTIGKTFDFEAGHRLSGLPPGHKCSRQHGHGYEAEVILTASSLQEPGFVADFGALAPFRQFVGTELGGSPPGPRRRRRHCAGVLPAH
ncbi:MAG: 6-carboxytetrahydropterin synthase [Streptosporangiaceae bacterium]|jgi:6-pyruvoyltetrahydropterin/6-carboxytetrahydropterin synthase